MYAPTKLKGYDKDFQLVFKKLLGHPIMKAMLAYI
jgi:hypothetical protein